MRSETNKSLLLTLILLTGCETSPAPPTGDCDVFRPIFFSQETKNWLLERTPWPNEVKVDMNKVGDHNEIWCKLCLSKEKSCLKTNTP